jgi:hypothetical protein
VNVKGFIILVRASSPLQRWAAPWNLGKPEVEMYVEFLVDGSATYAVVLTSPLKSLELSRLGMQGFEA